jgi:hypothetical protein
MLFLAVFAGFLAENQREHYIEHQREKKYIISLITDLKTDTAELNSVIDFNIIKFHGMDSLARLLSNNSLSNDDEKNLYYLNGKYAANIYTMAFSDRTIRQLLSSGNLRLIGKYSVSDTIMTYYGQSKEGILGQEKVYGDMSIRLILEAEKIFDLSTWSVKMKPDSTFFREIDPEKMKLINHDKKTLTNYAQMVTTARGFLSVYLEMLFGMQTKANGLLLFLEKEYHLK